MMLSDKSLRAVALLYASAWLATIIFSPSCYNGYFRIDLALGQAIGLLATLPIAAILLIFNVFSARANASLKLKGAVWRSIALFFMCLGILGCLTSLGCERFEAQWPTLLASDPFAFDSISWWKFRGQALMFLGFIGALAASVRRFSKKNS